MLSDIFMRCSYDLGRPLRAADILALDSAVCFKLLYLSFIYEMTQHVLDACVEVGETTIVINHVIPIEIDDLATVPSSMVAIVYSIPPLLICFSIQNPDNHATQLAYPSCLITESHISHDNRAAGVKTLHRKCVVQPEVFTEYISVRFCTVSLKKHTECQVPVYFFWIQTQLHCYIVIVLIFIYIGEWNIEQS